MPNISSFIKTIKKMDLTIRADFGDKIGDIVSVQVNRPLLPCAIIEYLNNSFIVTNDPRGLGSYKLYELRPFGCESEWTPVKISENFLNRD